MTAPALDQTEVEIVETLREVLGKEASLGQSLDAVGSAPGFDRSVHERLAELGFFGVSTSLEAGGLGLSSRVLGEFCVECGRVLLAGPWLEQLLAVTLLGQDLGVSLASDLIAGLAFVSLPLNCDAWRRPPVVEIAGDNARVRAGRCEIGFATGVDGWLVPARDATTDAVVLVRLSPDAARCDRRRSWSEVWWSDDVNLEDMQGTVVSEIAEDVVEQHLLVIARLLACVSVGSTEALLESTTGFLLLREQFGRPLGSFQALQHKMADVFIELEHTRSLVRASLEPERTEDADVLVAMAKVAADRLAVRAAETALQAHGGIGFTWELPVHHYLKEALRRRTLPEPTVAYREQLRNALIRQRT